MSFQPNETVSITLKIEGDEARNKLALLEKESRSLEKALKEVPEGSAEWQTLNKELNANLVQQQKLRAEVGVSAMTYKQLQTEVRNLTGELKKMTPGTADFIAKSKQLKEVEDRFKQVGKEMRGLSDGLDQPNKQGLWGKMVSGVNTVKGAFNAFLALAVVQYIFELGKKIFDTTAQFEKYDKVLTTALGSQKEARQSLEAIKVMAANTSYSVAELTEGYVKMVNRGLRPSQKEMIAMADLAASQGKTFDQLVEAALDAATGENERLKEFGISAKKSGDQVTFSFKGMQQTVANTPEAINAAIIAFGDMEGVAGSNAKMMETLGGKASNLGDSFDELTNEVGTGLKPVFIAIMDLILACIPALSLFGKAFASAALVVKAVVVGIVDTVNNAGMVIFKLGEAALEAAKGNLSGAKTAINEASDYGKKALFSLGESGKKTSKEIVGIWKNPEGEVEAKLAGKKQGEAHQKELTAAQVKEAEKRAKEKEKEMKAFADAEAKYDEKVKNDRAKALELIAQLESEHDATVAKNSLASDTAKIEEKSRKRLKEINDSLADEATKETARASINRNAEAEIEKTATEYRKKALEVEKEHAVKRAENALFITAQQKEAEQSLLDFKVTQAKGNATQLAAIAKERADLELRYLKEQLAQEEAAEKARIAADIADTDQAEAAILAVEKRYHQEAITAEAQTAAAKKAIDDDLRDKKQANLKNYSDMFSALLRGDISTFAAGMSQMVNTHKAAWQERISADMSNYESGAQAAQAAVSFLNDLAQRKAEKAIAEANRERDAKIGILTAELQVTESMITASSNFITALKSAETQRLAELERILTSETTSEEDKRAALKKYYSEQLQQMKAAEEEKIKELQRLANLAKTEDEKRAIEEKIRLAEKESEEKIRLATEEAEAKAEMIDALQEFTIESSETLLTDAATSSEKQIQLASDEAEQKADFKADLEETIAAENRKARATEMAEKQKAFRAQKKADIATALITGALAVLKALANFFPLNIILAATAAVVTGVQIAKIKNQPEPTFAHGGFVAQGGKHGNSYGTGGIALIDRGSGREVGEMEGDEAIISADQTAANMPLITEMFKNARTPGMRNKAVSSERGLQSSFRDGGTLFESPYWKKEMYLFGSKKRKAKEAATAAEIEAANAQKEADAYTSEMPSADTGAFDGIDGTEPNPSTAESQAAFEASQKQGETQLKLLQEIIDTLEATAEGTADALAGVEKAIGASADSTAGALKEMGNEVNALGSRIDSVKNAVNENVGATRGVESAVNNANANGVLYGILDRISNLK
ncbi:hypothetical protein [Dyadobacter sp. CY323]|uniref:hypothetical protein n=1 Tax=Dyadobacter sp. CY323 TaxID=2907302 RepID=UPI001F33509D|nr:hypothetical protein [Dyadobacter sp. CY323]MCE6987484.1 hypothetical protein [Dyadobacter sp. CY323]